MLEYAKLTQKTSYWLPGWGIRSLAAKEHANFGCGGGSDGSVLHLYFGGGYIGLYICHNLKV